MTEGPDIVAVPGIAALPPTTARQIGSGQVLVDPSSVVKELIDNALDARAKSIFVDITANTIDSIQVKDDGHGIPAEDRPLVCRRSYTSKIRDLHDLRKVGGKWLGFRGEALSSMAEMSSSLCVTTRVEGEPVAVKLKYGRDGELASVEHDSHPVGTTVKATKFFDFIPIRKQTASKNSAKLLAKIRWLMQAYALARPTIRFRLRVLKAKNSNGDFVYAPKAEANVEDAALKVIGKDCALQCDWTVLEADGFKVHAFLPKPGATVPKIAHQGAFISIDARPVSSSRGTIKQITMAYRDRLRKSNPSLAGVKDPFFCLNITCPPGSYDPNIEPAKDDVMFDNSDVVISVVDKLLKAYYSEVPQDVQNTGIPTPAQQQYEVPPEQPSSRIESSTMTQEDESTSAIEESPTTLTQVQPRWRSSMYGIDEDDLEFLQEDHTPVIDEEEGIRATEISNPWTIARMNSKVKPKQAVSNEQLLSPAKSQGGGNSHPSSPSPVVTPHRPRSVLPLTPQTLSKTNVAKSSLDVELERSIQHVSWPSSETRAIADIAQERTTDIRRRYGFDLSPLYTGMSNHLTQSDVHPTDSRLPNFSPSATSPQNMIPPGSSAPCSRHAQQTYTNKPFAPPTRGSHDTVLGQSLPSIHPFQPARRQHVPLTQGPRPPATTSSASRRPVLNAAERIVQNQLPSNNNSDIRDFFGRSTQRTQPPSQRNAPADSLSRASSAEPQPRSRRVRDHPQLYDDRGMDINLRGIVEQSRASSAGSQMSMLFDQRSVSDGNAQSDSAKEMEAYFRSQEQQHMSSPSHPNKVSQSPSHETSSKAPHPRHRRTIDALERTKSSKLPLERTPQGFHIQHLILAFSADIHAILQYSRELDMRRNSPEWGYSAEDAYDAFAEPVFEKTIMEWAMKLDVLLRERYEKVGRADTRCEIHGGIQRALDARKGSNNVVMSRVESVGHDIVKGAVGVFEKDMFRGYGDAIGVVVQQSAVETGRKVDDEEFDFDMEQFVDLTAEDERQIMGIADETNVEVVRSEYDEDIEDEMLMDL